MGDGGLYVAERDSDDSIRGLWEIPAGKIEFGEHPRAAAARELEEETGVVVNSSRLRHLSLILSNRFEDPDRHFLITLYALKWERGMKEPRVIPGIHSRSAWMHRQELRGLEKAGLCLPRLSEVEQAAWAALS